MGVGTLLSLVAAVPEPEPVAEPKPVAEPEANPLHGHYRAEYYRPYGHHGYRLWGRNKREAEPVADPEADPWFFGRDHHHHYYKHYEANPWFLGRDHHHYKHYDYRPYTYYSPRFYRNLGYSI